MTLQSQDDPRTEAAVWQAMVLFSTLSTAADVWHAVRERRAGRDPSEQETAAVVRPYLRRAAGDLQARLMQLQASRLRAEADDEGRVAALVRRYQELMALRQVAQELHTIHQRLLSLYPAVDEDLVEEARLLHATCEQWLAEQEGDDLSLFLHRALAFSGQLVWVSEDGY